MFETQIIDMTRDCKRNIQFIESPYFGAMQRERLVKITPEEAVIAINSKPWETIPTGMVTNAMNPDFPKVFALGNILAGDMGYVSISGKPICDPNAIAKYSRKYPIRNVENFSDAIIKSHAKKACSAINGLMKVFVVNSILSSRYEIDIPLYHYDLNNKDLAGSMIEVFTSNHKTITDRFTWLSLRYFYRLIDQSNLINFIQNFAYMDDDTRGSVLESFVPPLVFHVNSLMDALSIRGVSKESLLSEDFLNKIYKPKKDFQDLQRTAMRYFGEGEIFSVEEITDEQADSELETSSDPLLNAVQYNMMDVLNALANYCEITTKDVGVKMERAYEKLFEAGDAKGKPRKEILQNAVVTCRKLAEEEPAYGDVLYFLGEKLKGMNG